MFILTIVHYNLAELINENYLILINITMYQGHKYCKFYNSNKAFIEIK